MKDDAKATPGPRGKSRFATFMVDKPAPDLIIGVADGTADLRRAGG
jgi:hypothetical protein